MYRNTIFSKEHQTTTKMHSLKMMIIICALVAVCYGESRDKKHKYKYHHLYWHGFHYLAFLALKFKIILVLGSIFTIGMVAGKIFAVLKFAEYMKKNYFHDNHHEKVHYVNSHEHGHDYPPTGGFSAPGVSYEKSYSSGSNAYYDSLPPGFSMNKPSPNAQISANDDTFDIVPSQTYNLGPGQAYNSNQGYGRSINVEENAIYKHINMLNITEMVFDDMNLKTEDCKKKFVCEADFDANKSLVLRSAFNLLSDDSYSRYKTEGTITSLDECGKLYPNCLEVT